MLETLDELCVRTELGAEDLDRDLTTELAVRRTEDGGHAALAQDLVQAIAAAEERAEFSHAG